MAPMPTPLADLLAERVRGARSSVIREILALTETAEVLSLAGGMPNPGSFPVDDLAAAAQQAITADGGVALQYARTEGITELRELLAASATATTGRRVGADAVLVTTGSQQALDLLGRAFLEAGDVVAIESPGYLGAIQAFGAHRPEWLPVPVDADGLDTGFLEEQLAGGRRPKLVYTATDFQNPTGAVLSVERRRHLGELADRWGFLVVEDDPYGRIRFDEPTHPPVATFTDRCVSLGTTSKTIAPGLRLGWLIGPPDLVVALALLKQSVDLNTSALAQALTLSLLRSPGWVEDRTEALCRFYRPRAELLAGALAAALPQADVPPARGGLFLWVGTPGVDTAALLPRAIDAGVAFVPGAAFRTDGAPSDHLRVSFATLDESDLAEAATRLARAVNTLAGAAQR
jgi:2-aminoadipate transaminase